MNMTDSEHADRFIASCGLRTMDADTSIDFYLRRMSHILTLRKERYEDLNDMAITMLDHLTSGMYYMLCSLGQERRAWHTIQEDLS